MPNPQDQTEHLHTIPAHCPVTKQPLYISELTSQDGSVTIKGKFQIPQTAHLDAENQRVLDAFLRSRGVISTMEKELGMSYPTVRARIDNLLEALGLTPVKNERREEAKAEKERILKLLEEGEISPAQAKEQLKKVGSR